MKKIVGAALAATLAAGVATAELTTTLNYRMRATTFGYDSKYNKGNVTNTIHGFKYNGYAGDTDTLKFTTKTDVAGITFQLAPSSTAANTVGFDALNTYSGWLKFGDVTFTAGKFKDGVADGNYRVKKDCDAGNLEGVDLERFKLGTTFKGTGVFMDAIDGFGNTGNNFFMAEWSHKFGDNTIAASLGFVGANDFTSAEDIEKDGTAETKTVSSWQPGFVSRLTFKNKNVLNAEAIYKAKSVKRSNMSQAFGFYVMPNVGKYLTLNVGMAMSFDADEEVTNGVVTPEEKRGNNVAFEAMGIDLRARFAKDNFSATLFMNYSFTDGSYKALTGGISGSNASAGVGKAGWASKTDLTNSALWLALGARYKINDTVTVFCNAGLLAATGVNDVKYESVSPEWRVTPGAQFFAAPNASISVQCAFSGSSYENKTAAASGDKIQNFGIDIPVVLRVKF